MSRVRVHIDPAVCNSDVGTWHPGSAVAAKGWVVHPSKPHASWVQYVARQYGVIYWNCGLSERKVHQVREERCIGASGVPAVRQGNAGQLRSK